MQVTVKCRPSHTVEIHKQNRHPNPSNLFTHLPPSLPPSPRPESCSRKRARGTVKQRGERRSRGEKKVPFREAGHDGPGPKGQGESRKEPGQLAQHQEEGVRALWSPPGILCRSIPRFFSAQQAGSEYLLRSHVLPEESGARGVRCTSVDLYRNLDALLDM